MKRLYFLKAKKKQTNIQTATTTTTTTKNKARQINESGYTKGKYNLKVQLCKYNWY